MAYLTRALTGFRDAVNRAYPTRDKGSDGWIGDPDHQSRTSDHNPDPDGSVDAWDMDVDLRSGNDAAAIEHLKQVFQSHPGARYWIHNRVIAHRNTGWRRERYDGENPHDKHVHWNSNEATEDSTAPWVLSTGPSGTDTWSAVLGSPGLGLTVSAADWLKQFESARRALTGARDELAAVRNLIK